MMFGKHLIRDFQESCWLVFVMTNKSIWEWFDDRCLHWVPRKERRIEDPNDLFRLALAISWTNRVCALSSTNVALAIDQRSCFSATSTILKSISLVQECYRLSFFSNLTLVLKAYYQRQPTFVLKLTSLCIEEPRWALQGLQGVGQLWGLFDVSLGPWLFVWVDFGA